MALYNVPYAYMTVSAALKGMDPSMEEASYLNGAGTFSTALKVTLPGRRPVDHLGVLLRLRSDMRDVLDPRGSRRNAGHAVSCCRHLSLGRDFPLDYARAAAIGTLLFWISLIGVAFYRFASRVATRFVTVTARGYRTRFSGCEAGGFRRSLHPGLCDTGDHPALSRPRSMWRSRASPPPPSSTRASRSITSGPSLARWRCASRSATHC